MYQEYLIRLEEKMRISIVRISLLLSRLKLRMIDLVVIGYTIVIAILAALYLYT